MIITPKKWKLKYEKLVYSKSENVEISQIIDLLTKLISNLNISHLAYSGGIDSTIMLCLMTKVFGNVSTYIIASREDHPDIKFARQGSIFYNSNHHEFITKPSNKRDSLGDDAVKQLFENVSDFTNDLICCDGIDEFMCGYYKHIQENNLEIYKWFLSCLLSDHLEPLNKNSGNIKVYLPYLDEKIIELFSKIPLDQKMDNHNRKKMVVKIAKYLKLPDEIIYRNKYGFCDAFLEKDK